MNKVFSCVTSIFYTSKESNSYYTLSKKDDDYGLDQVKAFKEKSLFGDINALTLKKTKILVKEHFECLKNIYISSSLEDAVFEVLEINTKKSSFIKKSYMDSINLLKFDDSSIKGRMYERLIYITPND